MEREKFKRLGRIIKVFKRMSVETFDEYCHFGQYILKHQLLDDIMEDIARLEPYLF